MNGVLDRTALLVGQLEVVVEGGELQGRRGMAAEQAGRFLVNLGRLYSEFCEAVPIERAYPDVPRLPGDDLTFDVPTSELNLLGARAGSMAFLFEVVLTVQASLVSPLPTAIANFMGVLDALKLLRSLMPGHLKAWDSRLADKDERELATIANIVSEVVKVAGSVEKITVTTAGGNTVVLEGAAFRRFR